MSLPLCAAVFPSTVPDAKSTLVAVTFWEANTFPSTCSASVGASTPMPTAPSVTSDVVVFVNWTQFETAFETSVTSCKVSASIVALIVVTLSWRSARAAARFDAMFSLSIPTFDCNSVRENVFAALRLLAMFWFKITAFESMSALSRVTLLCKSVRAALRLLAMF